jgi:hypothetical protein
MSEFERLASYEEIVIRDYSTPGLKRNFLPHTCRSTTGTRCDTCFGPVEAVVSTPTEEGTSG